MKQLFDDSTRGRMLAAKRCMGVEAAALRAAKQALAKAARSAKAKTRKLGASSDPTFKGSPEKAARPTPALEPSVHLEETGSFVETLGPQVIVTEFAKTMKARLVSTLLTLIYRFCLCE